jgi:hypothetical protein
MKSQDSKMKKLNLAKQALRFGYAILIIAIIGGVCEIFFLKQSTIQWWKFLIEIGMLFVFGVLTQFGLFNHLDKRLFFKNFKGEDNEEK